MTLSGIHFSRVSDRVLATVHHGVEYRIKEHRNGTYVVFCASAALYYADDLEEAAGFISDDEGWD